MKVLFINSLCGYGSTGRICADIAMHLLEQGDNCMIAYGRGNTPPDFAPDTYRISSRPEVLFHALFSRLFDIAGFLNARATKRLISRIEAYDPDVIHLHNLHGYYLNVEILFDYLRTANRKVIWTLHDCWAFTGHCSHFSKCGCERWKEFCGHCPQRHEYPKSLLLDNSHRNFLKKKRAFTGIKNLSIVTPSNWLAEQVKASFLGEYPVKVIHNGIDLNKFLFASTLKMSTSDNVIHLLGVANVWSEKKGLADFVRLSTHLPENYRLRLVGVTPNVRNRLPANIETIPRTTSLNELSKYYAEADVFLNLSHEETYPTVSLEAQACGTPVVTYASGGSAETITSQSGVSIPVSSHSATIISAIDSLLTQKREGVMGTPEHCLQAARIHDVANMVTCYLSIYKG